MLNFLLASSLAALFFVVFFRKRPFDFFTIFVTFFIYNYSMSIVDIIDFGGFSYTDLSLRVPAWLKIYVFAVSIMLSVLVLAYDNFLSRYLSNQLISIEKCSGDLYSERLALNFLIVPLIVLILYLLSTNAGGLLGSKMDIKQQDGGLIAVIAGFSQVVFFLSLRQRHILGILMSMFTVGVFLVIGSRSNILFFALIYMIYKYGGVNVKLLSFKNFFTIILSLVAVFIILIVKLFYKKIKSGDLEQVVSSLSQVDVSVVLDLLLVEPKAVVMNFITLVEHVDYSGNVGYLFFSPIPFLGDLYRNAFSIDLVNTSKYLKDNFYLIDFGMASSVLGEVYSFFGIFGLLFFTISVFFLLAYSSWLLVFSNNLLFHMHVPTLIILFSYMHRTALLNVLSNFKMPLFLIVCLLIFIGFHRILPRVIK